MYVEIKRTPIAFTLKLTTKELLRMVVRTAMLSRHTEQPIPPSPTLPPLHRDSLPGLASWRVPKYLKQDTTLLPYQVITRCFWGCFTFSVNGAGYTSVLFLP